MKLFDGHSAKKRFFDNLHKKAATEKPRSKQQVVLRDSIPMGTKLTNQAKIGRENGEESLSDCERKMRKGRGIRHDAARLSYLDRQTAVAIHLLRTSKLMLIGWQANQPINQLTNHFT